MSTGDGPPAPVSGLLAVRIGVDIDRLGEPRRLLENAGVRIRAKRITASEGEPGLSLELWIEFTELHGLEAILEVLRSAARRVDAPRVWCARCARWHDLRRAGTPGPPAGCGRAGGA